jgi:hypothetical protein
MIQQVSHECYAIEVIQALESDIICRGVQASCVAR